MAEETKPKAAGGRNLAGKGAAELRAIARKMGIAGAARMTKRGATDAIRSREKQDAERGSRKE